ncbi:MAG: hypothetical protein SXV54_08135 [Chloroflexota bacterium]|nr:hypothetical protein [Chloroflexota bacterium]
MTEQFLCSTIARPLVLVANVKAVGNLAFTYVRDPGPCPEPVEGWPSS